MVLRVLSRVHYDNQCQPVASVLMVEHLRGAEDVRLAAQISLSSIYIWSKNFSPVKIRNFGTLLAKMAEIEER